MSALGWPCWPSETYPGQKVRGPAAESLCLLVRHLTFWASLIVSKAERHNSYLTGEQMNMEVPEEDTYTHMYIPKRATKGRHFFVQCHQLGE